MKLTKALRGPASVARAAGRRRERCDSRVRSASASSGPKGGPNIPRDGFCLVKWYLDCVDPDGRALVAYWASLAWRGVALTWRSASLYAPDLPPLHRSILGVGPSPRIDDGTIAWDAPELGCSLRATVGGTPSSATLLRDDRGSVEWACESPASGVTVRLSGAEPVRGPGYVERLSLTIPPWRLPIREVRWGRWIEPDTSRSIVWIDWRGRWPASWGFVDGEAVPVTEVSDGSLRVGDRRLTLDRARTLEERSIGERLASVPGLRAVVPRSFLALRETKWVGEGRLDDGGDPATRTGAARVLPAGPTRIGQALHERAVFG